MAYTENQMREYALRALADRTTRQASGEVHIESLLARMRLLEVDHEPDGWPAVQMRDISALCDEVERRFGIQGELVAARRAMADAKHTQRLLAAASNLLRVADEWQIGETARTELRAAIAEQAAAPAITNANLIGMLRTVEGWLRDAGADEQANQLEEFTERARAAAPAWLVPPSNLRAAEMLTAYAEVVKATGQYAEMHYIPEIEFVIEQLRATHQQQHRREGK